MKKTLFILGCYVLAMASCASPEERAAAAQAAKNPTEASATGAGTAAPSAAEILKGEQLIAKSDCVACHNKDQKIIGPAYVDVAAKYPFNDENVSHLVDKIIAGGKGVWGEIPMTPHESLSKDDASTMVKYILSLKK